VLNHKIFSWNIWRPPRCSGPRTMYHMLLSLSWFGSCGLSSTEMLATPLIHRTGWILRCSAYQSRLIQSADRQARYRVNDTAVAPLCVFLLRLSSLSADRVLVWLSSLSALVQTSAQSHMATGLRRSRHITPLTRVAFVYNGPKGMELAHNPRYRGGS